MLLDAQDWMTDAQLGALWREITRTAAPAPASSSGPRKRRHPSRPGLALPARPLAATTREASARGFAADRAAIYGGFHLYRLAA